MNWCITLGSSIQGTIYVLWVVDEKLSDVKPRTVATLRYDRYERFSFIRKLHIHFFQTNCLVSGMVNILTSPYTSSQSILTNRTLNRQADPTFYKLTTNLQIKQTNTFRISFTWPPNRPVNYVKNARSINDRIWTTWSDYLPSLTRVHKLSTLINLQAIWHVHICCFSC